MNPLSNMEKVAEFHEVFGHPTLSEPQVPSAARVKLRLNLILEEVRELVEACVKNGISNNLHRAVIDIRNAMLLIHNAKDQDFGPNLVKVADALTDILYVAYGAGLEFGVDLNKTFVEVHDSNMSKLGADGKPVYNEQTGKVLKGPNYRDPDLAKVLGIS